MNDFNFEETLKQKLDYARGMVASKLTEKETVKILDSVSPDSVKRRFENKTLQKLYKRRISSWKNNRFTYSHCLFRWCFNAKRSYR